MAMIDYVSNLTRLTFPDVMELSAEDFFGYMIYVNHKAEKEAEELKRIKRYGI